MLIMSFKFTDRSSTPVSSEPEVSLVYRDPGHLLDDTENSAQQNPVVTDLASAMLQIAQCVEKKYLRKPLGECFGLIFIWVDFLY